MSLLDAASGKMRDCDQANRQPGEAQGPETNRRGDRRAESRGLVQLYVAGKVRSGIGSEWYGSEGASSGQSKHSRRVRGLQIQRPVSDECAYRAISARRAVESRAAWQPQIAVAPT